MSMLAHKNRPLHNVLFLLGFAYYLFIPPIIGTFEYLSDYPAMPQWLADFNELSAENLAIYFCIIISYLVSFYCGSYFILFIKRRATVRVAYNRHLNLSFFSLPILIASLVIAFKNREILFSGYSMLYDISILGPISTLSILQTYIVIFNLTSKSTKSLLHTISVISLLISSTLLMGLGSRMYVLIPIISVLIFNINYSEKIISVRKYLAVGMGIMLTMLAIGAWRIGTSFDPGFYRYIFFAEPIFTWWSVSTFLANNDLLPVALPINFLSSVINFVPSFLFKNKSDFIFDLHSFYSFSAPLGADSIFVSIQGNFGYIFGMFYLFIIGLYFSVIKTLSLKSIYIKTYYILICSLLPFQFFRDSFTLINKQLFWNMLVLPASLYITLLCVVKVRRTLFPKNKSRLAISSSIDGNNTSL